MLISAGIFRSGYVPGANRGCFTHAIARYYPAMDEDTPALRWHLQRLIDQYVVAYGKQWREHWERDVRAYWPDPVKPRLSFAGGHLNHAGIDALRMGRCVHAAYPHKSTAAIAEDVASVLAPGDRDLVRQVQRLGERHGFTVPYDK
jgi:hypothetical protein